MRDGSGRVLDADPAFRREPESDSRRLSRNVAALGVVSLLMGMSSAMIHGLLPVFLVVVLGSSTLWVGLIEGVAESTASFMKLPSGALSDWMRRRKPLVVIGYGLSALSKPLFAVADLASTVLLARFVDRVAKGIRDAPRDALLADLTPSGIRGSGYGLRHALYTIGAATGPIAAIALMAVSEGDFRLVFWVAAVPAFVSVAVLVKYVKDSPEGRELGEVRSTPRRALMSRLPAPYWWTVAIAAVLALGRFSPAFLTLKAYDVGIGVGFAPMVLVLMNLVYGIAAYPFGVLADRLNPRLQLALGTICLLAADVLLASADALRLAALGVGLWGLQMGAMQGLLSRLIAEAADERLRGTAFGIYDLAVGSSTLMASAIAGALWAAFGPATTFSFAAAVACVGALIILFAQIPPPAKR